MPRGYIFDGRGGGASFVEEEEEEDETGLRPPKGSSEGWRVTSARSAYGIWKESAGVKELMEACEWQIVLADLLYALDSLLETVQRQDDVG